MLIVDHLTTMAPNLPNPPTTMTQALLTPETQYQVAISLCLAVGTLGAYIWDVLLHLGEEYKMLAKSRIRLGTVVYFSSRVWTLLALLGTTLFATYPLQYCELAITLTEVFWAIAVASTSFLFFLRARAIFNGNPWLISIFFCLWLSVAGTAAIVPTTVHAVNVGLTAYCIDDSISPAAVSLGITPLLYHTVIFLAISWHLSRHSWSGDFRTFFTGKSLPSFSKALLKDGQFYYLLLVTLNTITVAMFFNGQLAPAYRLAFAIPNLMLGNATACMAVKPGNYSQQRTSYARAANVLSQHAPDPHRLQFHSHRLQSEILPILMALAGDVQDDAWVIDAANSLGALVSDLERVSAIAARRCGTDHKSISLSTSSHLRAFAGFAMCKGNCGCVRFKPPSDGTKVKENTKCTEPVCRHKKKHHTEEALQPPRSLPTNPEERGQLVQSIIGDWKAKASNSVARAETNRGLKSQAKPTGTASAATKKKGKTKEKLIQIASAQLVVGGIQDNGKTLRLTPGAATTQSQVQQSRCSDPEQRAVQRARRARVWPLWRPSDWLSFDEDASEDDITHVLSNATDGPFAPHLESPPGATLTTRAV
ncbi:hypothetical protein HMN09_01339300 [Mycena chlorophos]|uniref:DUF6533 domain-containing protein n=1 Tax=Mycena chlorophos TaxID=658473 RepID=A0A8H6RYU6_MYCCL|nr:hypothetical protein HMN09_01339300 [Mycena chlorophos]